MMGVYLTSTSHLPNVCCPYKGVFELEHCSPPSSLVIYPSGCQDEGSEVIEREGRKNGRKGERVGGRKGVTQTDRKTDGRAHSDVHLLRLDKWNGVLVNVSVPVWVRSTLTADPCQGITSPHLMA